MHDIMDKIKHYMQEYQPMESEFNFLIEYLILKKNNPKKILEIGAGAAGWALTINELLDKKDLHFVLVENFGKTNYPEELWWPKNKKDFIEYVSTKNQEFNYILKEKYTKEKKIDVLRFDAWGFTLEDFINLLSDLKKKSIIFFDDFALNKDSDLVILVLELAKKRLIYPIWISETVSCWSRSKEYSKEMIFYLKQNENVIRQMIDYLEFFRHSKFDVLNIDLDMIQTKIF